jgi:hypothetical protein
MGQSPSFSKRILSYTELREDRLKAVCTFCFCIPLVPRRSYLRTEFVLLSIILKGPVKPRWKIRLVLVSLMRKKV